MSLFTSIEPAEIAENAVRLIGSDWALLTAGTQDRFNTMTISWGFMEFLWNRPCAVCFVRPSRHTFSFIERADDFTLSFFNEDMRGALHFCGANSGRDTDKIAATGLVPKILENGTVAFEQAKLILSCRKVYADYIKPDSFIEKSIVGSQYSDGSFHKMYIAEITGALEKQA